MGAQLNGVHNLLGPDHNFAGPIGVRSYLEEQASDIVPGFPPDPLPGLPRISVLPGMGSQPRGAARGVVERDEPSGGVAVGERPADVEEDGSDGGHGFTPRRRPRGGKYDPAASESRPPGREGESRALLAVDHGQGVGVVQVARRLGRGIFRESAAAASSLKNGEPFWRSIEEAEADGVGGVLGVHAARAQGPVAWRRRTPCPRCPSFEISCWVSSQVNPP